MATDPLYIVLASPEREAVAAAFGCPANVFVSMRGLLAFQKVLSMEERSQGGKLSRSMLEQDASNALKQLKYMCLGEC